MSAESGSTFTLFIESGLHAGAVQRLSPGIYTLGSELDADIVLSDGEVKAVHLIVELGPRGIRLEPLQGAVAVDGEKADLEPGGERHVGSPAAFAIGETRIRITAPKDAVRSQRRLRTAAIAAGLAALAVVSFQILDPLGVTPLEGPAAPQAAMNEPLANLPADGASMAEGVEASADDARPSAAAGDGVDAASPGITLDQAAAALRDRLAAEDFPDIAVKTGVDRIMVRGEADPARMDDWQTVRIWFDGIYGQELLLVADIEPARVQEPPKLAIEAVWSGKDPYLIAGGQRFAVGAHVGDGWTIGRIEAKEITFTRGSKSFSLTL